MKLGEYVKYDAIGLAELVEKGEITPDELATLAQEAAKKVNDKLNAIVSIFDEPYQEEAIEGAKFKGAPTFMKDLGASVIGITQESGSRLTAGLVSPLTTNFAQNVLNSGFQFPNRRLTINLAPADLPKDGARLDLPIAIGILAASGQLEPEVLSGFEFIGELALNGQLRQVTGSLAVARAIKAERLAIALSQVAANEQGQNNSDTSPPITPQLIVPIDNGHEASRVDGVTILAAQSLKAVCDHLQ